MRIYDRNPLKPNGTPERIGYCLAVVYVQGTGGASRQCSRRATHDMEGRLISGRGVLRLGPGTYQPKLCKQHAAKWRHVEIPIDYKP